MVKEKWKERRVSQIVWLLPVVLNYIDSSKIQVIFDSSYDSNCWLAKSNSGIWKHGKSSAYIINGLFK